MLQRLRTFFSERRRAAAAVVEAVTNVNDATGVFALGFGVALLVIGLTFFAISFFDDGHTSIAISVASLLLSAGMLAALYSRQTSESDICWPLHGTLDE